MDRRPSRCGLPEETNCGGVADKLANEDHRQVFRPRKENLKSPNLPVTEGVIWNPEEQAPDFHPVQKSRCGCLL
ncbi:hypothetical protein Y1Q_0022213 [Alligator mississippiensis]|uniref:Uncharacterized protein n=1 Tax=Alligator mississippiensis TaxID=8496 RepID=A0A151NZP3_ALLMI|nr:hypothetical protein Y1Q_0022213 [Alligator mississippiensis]